MVLEGTRTSSNTAKEEVDASGSFDRVLVSLTLGVQVLGLSVEDVRVLGAACQKETHPSSHSLDIHEREEVLEHEGVVRLGVVPRDPDVFVLKVSGAFLTSK